MKVKACAEISEEIVALYDAYAARERSQNKTPRSLGQMVGWAGQMRRRLVEHGYCIAKIEDNEQ